jgi:cytidylate kinase
MQAQFTFEKCRAFVDSQLKAAQGQIDRKSEPLRPVITLSRETGSGAHSIAGKLVDYLQKHDHKTRGPWTAFDRNLVEKVLDDHHLPQRLAQYMAEEKLPTIADGLEELLGLHPSSCVLVQNTVETILKLAHMGHVILVGRGSHLITQSFPNAFHVRIVGSLEKRSAYMAEVLNLSQDQAKEFVRTADSKRQRYLKNYFGADAEDLRHFHLVINTDRVSFDEAAIIIGETVLRRITAP